MTLADQTQSLINDFRKSVALAALFLFVAGGCTPVVNRPDVVAYSGDIMGTTYHVKVVGGLSDDAMGETAKAIETTLNRVDSRMSTYKPESELSRLNAHPGNEPFEVSAETFKVLEMALEVNAQSDGAFDVTVGPLVNAWGFGPDSIVEAPSDAGLEKLRALSGPGQIHLAPETTSVIKRSDAVYCDLSAIAKGYAVDQVAEALAGLGYAHFMVEVGGEVRTAGLNASGVPWKIAIEKPEDDERVVQDIVGLSGVSLATSGNYRNFYLADGKRVSHTISPRTGRPVDHSLASASVIHPECALADAYATTLMVLGPEAGLAFAEAHGLAVLLIIHGENGGFITRQTPSFAKYVAAG